MHPAPFRVGDRVVTDYLPRGRHVVRVVVKIEPHNYSQTRWWVWTRNGTPLSLDSAWFRRAPEGAQARAVAAGAQPTIEDTLRALAAEIPASEWDQMEISAPTLPTE